MRLFLTLAVLSNTLLTFGQQKVKYSPDFKFKDGIYLAFQDFKNNNPIAVTHIISNLDIRSENYIEQVLESDMVDYYDNLFEERSVDVKDVWGFSKNGKIYIGRKEIKVENDSDEADWFPLVVIGAFSYFTATSTVRRFIPPTPGYRMASRGTILDDGALYPDDGTAFTETIPIQMLLDFSNGEVIHISSGDLSTVPTNIMQHVLKTDSELLNSFNKLHKRDQKKSSMFYLRRFNERNPIYFPLSRQ